MLLNSIIVQQCTRFKNGLIKLRIGSIYVQYFKIRTIKIRTEDCFVSHKVTRNLRCNQQLSSGTFASEFLYTRIGVDINGNPRTTMIDNSYKKKCIFARAMQLYVKNLKKNNQYGTD